MYRFVHLLIFVYCLVFVAGCTVSVGLDPSAIPVVRVDLMESDGADKSTVSAQDDGSSAHDEPGAKSSSQILHIINLIDGGQVYSGTWMIAERENVNAELAAIVGGVVANSQISAVDRPAILLAHPLSEAMSDTLTLFVPGIADSDSACTNPSGLFWQEVFVLEQEADTVSLPVAELCLYQPGTNLLQINETLESAGLAPDALIVDKADAGPVFLRFVSQGDDPGAGAVISRLLCEKLRKDTSLGLAVRKYVGCQ